VAAATNAGLVARLVASVTGASDIVFWPADATPLLDALRRRGWPVDTAA
jgi:hypothetical protein